MVSTLPLPIGLRARRDPSLSISNDLEGRVQRSPPRWRYAKRCVAVIRVEVVWLVHPTALFCFILFTLRSVWSVLSLLQSPHYYLPRSTQLGRVCICFALLLFSHQIMRAAREVEAAMPPGQGTSALGTTTSRRQVSPEALAALRVQLQHRMDALVAGAADTSTDQMDLMRLMEPPVDELSDASYIRRVEIQATQMLMDTLNGML